MKKLICIIIFLIPTILSGQRPNIIIKDFNNDGYSDTLTSFYDGGSGFGGIYVTLINGNTKEKIELERSGCFCDIKNFVLIPPELKTESNRQFLEVVKDELLPGKMNMPDASLQWLISSNLYYKELSDHTYYDLVINSPIKWIKGKINPPETYYIDIKGDTLHKLYFSESEIPAWYDSTRNEGCLIYYGHNHFPNGEEKKFILADSSSIYKVYKTSHGVVLNKGDSYAWIFVADYRLTGGPDKLRWESIGKVTLIDQFVILQLINIKDFSNPLFIIDIEKGISARLRHDGNYHNISYKIEKDKILLERNFETKSYELEKLFSITY
jgi:hypothetical protein